MKFLLASLKTLTNSKNCSESHQISFPAFLCSHWSIFLVYIHSRNKLSEVGYWKDFLSQLVSDFLEARRNFNVD
jgi:hypothetical protein